MCFIPQAKILIFQVTMGGAVYAYDGNVAFGKPGWMPRFMYGKDISGYDARLSTTQKSFIENCINYKTFALPYGRLVYWNGRLHPVAFTRLADLLQIGGCYG